MYFAVVGLDILKRLDNDTNGDNILNKDKIAGLTSEEKKVLVDFVYMHHLSGTKHIDSSERKQTVSIDYPMECDCCSGFIGATYLAHNRTGLNGLSNLKRQSSNEADTCTLLDKSKGNYHQAHIAATYCALALLLTLQDDLSRLDKVAIIRGKALRLKWLV